MRLHDCLLRTLARVLVEGGGNVNLVFYEISLFKKNITQSEVEEILTQFPYQALSIMEAHYLTNNCFIEEDYIVKNRTTIDSIPIKIIHGKQDSICPFKFALELNSKLTNSELFLVEGGHSDSEPEIERKIIELINKTW